MLIMDVDGTLTDGKIYIGANGEIMKAFNVKDGYAIARLADHNIISCIITGRQSGIVTYRAKELKISELHQGINDKLKKLKEIATVQNLSLNEIAYIGDDLNDIECMKYCGFSGCPTDAIDEVKQIADYVCKNKAGDGAVREFIEVILEDNS